MVYCGKPSRGCQCCKTRRIKCDEKRPACTQCTKTGRQCPGYSENWALIHRNETENIKRKVQRSSHGGKASSQSARSSVSPVSRGQASPSQTSSEPLSRSSSWSDGLDLPLDLNGSVPVFVSSDYPDLSPKSIDLSITQFHDESALQQLAAAKIGNSISFPLARSKESEATTFFFVNFILVPQQAGSMRGYLEFLIPMYNNSPANSVLRDATHAVALTALGNYPGNTALKHDSRRYYGRAMRGLQSAITDVEVAKSDDMLLSTLLFSLYEAITSTAETNSGWANHIDGAIALVKLRGTDQFKSAQGANLFRSVRHCMLTKCIQRSQPIGDFPAPKGWRSEVGDQSEAHDLTVISLSLPDIRMQAKELLAQDKTPQVISDILALINTTKDVDGQIEHWALTLPPLWDYRTVRTCLEMPVDIENSNEWLGPVHAYGDLFVANVMNDMRVSRIFCQNVILHCIESLPPEHRHAELENLCKKARSVTRTLVNDICASVPFHMQWASQQNGSSVGQDRLGTFLLHADTSEAIGGYFMVWPLYVCKELECIPAEQRIWLRGRLAYVGKCFGLSPAQVLLMARRHVLTGGPSFP